MSHFNDTAWDDYLAAMESLRRICKLLRTAGYVGPAILESQGFIDCEAAVIKHYGENYMEDV